MLFRLDTPDLADTLAGRNSADARTQELSQEVEQADERLKDLAGMFGRQEIGRAEWIAARKPTEARRDNAQRQLGALSHSSALTGLVGNGVQLRGSWSELNLSRQQAITAALVDYVTVGPGQLGARSLDPERVSITWRL